MEWGDLVELVYREPKSGKCSHKDTKTQRHKEKQIIDGVGAITAQMTAWTWISL